MSKSYQQSHSNLNPTKRSTKLLSKLKKRKTKNDSKTFAIKGKISKFLNDTGKAADVRVYVEPIEDEDARE